MKLYQRIAPTLAIILSLSALCLGGAIASGRLIITSKNIRNGTVSSVDLKNNNVKSVDVANSGITDPDIASNAVTPADVEMPPPVVADPTGLNGAVTTDGFSQLADAGSYSKVQPESTLEVQWAGVASSGIGTNCIFQVRVDGAEPQGGGGEVFTQGNAQNVSTVGLFPALPAGPHEVEVWAKASAYAGGGGGPSCTLGGQGNDSTFVMNEAVQ